MLLACGLLAVLLAGWLRALGVQWALLGRLGAQAGLQALGAAMGLAGALPPPGVAEAGQAVRGVAEAGQAARQAEAG